MVKRLILGALPGGAYGLRCSKPGYDVTTYPVDPTGLVFDSAWPSALPIYYQTGAFSLANGASTSFTYPASLAYTPFFSWLVAWALAGPWAEIQAFAVQANSFGAGSPRMTALAMASGLSFVNGTGATIYLSAVVYRQAA